jgi:hypothetical protein
MRHRSSRLAAIFSVVITPAAALLALAFAITVGPSRSIERGPLESGEKIGRSRAWLELSGFYPAELEEGRSFSWMGEAGRIRLARLDRSVAIKLSFWVQPAVATRRVELQAAVDGLALPPMTLVSGSQRVDIDLPATRAGRAIVDLRVSQTIVPGAADRRTLGLRVDGVALEATDGRVRIPWDSLRSATISGLGLGIALALTLGARPLAFALGLGAGGWLGFLLAFDSAFLGAYPDRLAFIGLCMAALGALCAAATRAGADERWGLRAATGVIVVLTACKLALFFHPMTAVGDSIFHVHRAQTVQRGEYFFTSITPRPFFEFPYPPGLYVFVSPLWDAVHGDMEHVWLLRSVVLAAEATLAIAVYAVVFSNWRHRLAAFVASALTLLLPVGLYTICTSNLTNSFGQSMFGIGLATLLCAYAAPRRGWILIASGAAFVCAGFLSHFSTFSVGVPLLPACAASVWLGGRGLPRRTTTIALTVALFVAATVSVAVYYAHFVPVYKQTVERVLTREGAAAERSMVAPVSVKAARIATTAWMEFGAAALLAAAAAGLLLMRARANDPLTLALMGWAAVVLGFWLLAVLTAIEMRASLTAQPLVAILAGLAIARAAQDGRWARVAVTAAIASIVLRAVSDWAGCLGFEGFWRI